MPTLPRLLLATLAVTTLSASAQAQSPVTGQPLGDQAAVAPCATTSASAPADGDAWKRSGTHGHGERHGHRERDVHDHGWFFGRFWDDDHDDEDDDDDDYRRGGAGPARAGTTPPPTNGLFNSDTAPRVQTN
ncbi:hypothetical protein [Tropicimonas sp. IMCC6043]|uniref:hypothetical protein n=1 Tax=Tropicimonas sp. IMCC6043 TaxID=2510645 RepID=UPI00101BBD3C|nr:hypothetical protein [Tropicimonas sp. IMCC6043]RYH09044.1 hypothetical protein EU800_13775 [Tropicimonas sp. IMCC6043]